MPRAVGDGQLAEPLHGGQLGRRQIRERIPCRLPGPMRLAANVHGCGGQHGGPLRAVDKRHWDSEGCGRLLLLAAPRSAGTEDRQIRGRSWRRGPRVPRRICLGQLWQLLPRRRPGWECKERCTYQLTCTGRLRSGLQVVDRAVRRLVGLQRRELLPQPRRGVRRSRRLRMCLHQRLQRHALRGCAHSGAGERGAESVSFGVPVDHDSGLQSTC